MRLASLVIVLAVAQVAVATADDKDARKALTGVWKGRVIDGATGHELTITEELITGTKDGTRDLGKGSFTIDTSTTPWQMDATPIKEGREGKPYLGICTLEGDTLKWCVGSPGKDRPTEFSTGDGKFCLMLTRQKP